MEHGLFQVHFTAATGGVDEGVRGAWLELRVLFFHRVFGGMIA